MIFNLLVRGFFSKEQKADEGCPRAREAVLNHVKIQTEASKEKSIAC